MAPSAATTIRSAVNHIQLTPGKLVWKDKLGREWNIEDMTDSHIENCMRFMLRNAEGWKGRVINEGWNALMHMRGEMAQLYLEQDINRLEDVPAFRVVIDSDEFRAFRLERRRRAGLGPLPLRNRPEWLEAHSSTIENIMREFRDLDYHYCSDCGGYDRLEEEMHDILVKYLR